MQYSRQLHWQFLEDELKAETEDFKRTFLAPAISLLENNEGMYVGQFIGFRDGEMIMKFPNTRPLPRKGEFLLCMIVPDNLRNYHNWGNMTYRDLFSQRYDATESVCIWHSMFKEDKRFSLVGFHKVSVEFAQLIMDVPGCILIFAPNRPPIDYMLNLQRLVLDTSSASSASVLDAEYDSAESWTSIPLNNAHVSDFVYMQLNLSDTMVLHGPPGTGKTQLIAELCARLCSEGKSVLVTAMTNRALMEIIEKPALTSMLSNGQVYKTNVTIDEIKEIGQIQSAKEIVPVSSSLVLSTFYLSSGFAANSSMEQPFDYVIMDEASQAVTAMFAAAKKMGKRNLWVGDANQLAPIVSLNKERIKVCNYSNLITGFELMAGCSSAPVYQLTQVYRFGQRTADYTGIFYNNTLVAKNKHHKRPLHSIQRLLHPDGGPSLVLTDMNFGDYTPQFAIMLVACIVSLILNNDSKTQIAVLTCMKKTMREIQRVINLNVGVHQKVMIETIARIQGLTTDVAILLIPSTSYLYSLEQHLFNVATSRAKEHTIIIADKNILDYPIIPEKVREFLTKLQNEQSVYIPASQNSNYEQLSRQLLLSR